MLCVDRLPYTFMISALSSVLGAPSASLFSTPFHFFPRQLLQYFVFTWKPSHPLTLSKWFHPRLVQENQSHEASNFRTVLPSASLWQKPLLQRGLACPPPSNTVSAPCSPYPSTFFTVHIQPSELPLCICSPVFHLPFPLECKFPEGTDLACLGHCSIHSTYHIVSTWDMEVTQK